MQSEVPKHLVHRNVCTLQGMQEPVPFVPRFGELRIAAVKDRVSDQENKFNIKNLHISNHYL